MIFWLFRFRRQTEKEKVDYRLRQAIKENKAVQDAMVGQSKTMCRQYGRMIRDVKKENETQRKTNSGNSANMGHVTPPFIEL